MICLHGNIAPHIHCTLIWSQQRVSIVIQSIMYVYTGGGALHKLNPFWHTVELRSLPSVGPTTVDPPQLNYITKRCTRCQPSPYLLDQMWIQNSIVRDHVVSYSAATESCMITSDQCWGYFYNKKFSGDSACSSWSEGCFECMFWV